MDSTAYNRDPLRQNARNPLHSMALHGIHCIQSGSISPRCMESSAFNDAAWNPLHSKGMVWAMLRKILCIQSGCIGPLCMDSTALHLAAWTPVHYISVHGILCIQ